MSNNPPVKEIRMGCIKACIWANETSSGATRHNVTVSKLYKDGDEWKETGSYGRDDLPIVSEVFRQAWTWIFEQAQSKSAAKEAA